VDAAIPSDTDQTQPEQPGRGKTPQGHPLIRWLIANARWVWPVLVVTVVVAASWSDLKNIQYRQVRQVLHQPDSSWLIAVNEVLGHGTRFMQ
jgi:hypothetical protein